MNASQEFEGLCYIHIQMIHIPYLFRTTNNTWPSLLRPLCASWEQGAPLWTQSYPTITKNISQV